MYARIKTRASDSLDSLWWCIVLLSVRTLRLTDCWTFTGDGIYFWTAADWLSAERSQVPGDGIYFWKHGSASHSYSRVQGSCLRQQPHPPPGAPWNGSCGWLQRAGRNGQLRHYKVNTHLRVQLMFCNVWLSLTEQVLHHYQMNKPFSVSESKHSGYTPSGIDAADSVNAAGLFVQ